MNILVTGANGQLGQELQALAKTYTTFNFVWADRQVLDISNEKEVNRLLEQTSFDYCVNCAAYTAVDKAESDSETAQEVNVDGVRHLMNACANNHIRMIHISTDYVYHNGQNTPFKEEDETAPKGVYACTKLEGEKVVLKGQAEGMVIRTSWVYSSFGNNFVKTMLRLGADRDALSVIFDQIGSPTYARDLAGAILDIIDQNPTKLEGIYHYSNEGVCSWYDFAEAIFELEGINCEVSPIETKDYPTPAKRPPFSLLNKAKIKEDFGLKIPHWRKSLQDCLSLLK